MGALAAFAAQFVLAHALGPENFGLITSSLATVTMMAPMAGFGLSQFWLKAYGAEGWAASRWLKSSAQFIALSSSLAIASIVGWSVLGPVDTATRSALLLLLPVLISVLCMDLVCSKLRLEERHASLSWWQMVIPLGRLGVALSVLLMHGNSALFAAVGYALVSLLIAIMAISQLKMMFAGDLALQGHGTRPVDRPHEARVPDVKSLWSRVWAYGVATALYPVFFQIGTVLLKYLKGNEQAGIFGLGMSVMAGIYLIPSTIYQKFLLSKLHRWMNHSEEKFWRVYRAGSRWMLVAGVVVALVMACATWLLAPIALGAKYQRVANVLLVLSVCIPLRFLSTAVGSALLSEKQMRYRVYAMASSTVAVIAFNLVLISAWAAMGSAVATLLGEAVLLGAMYAGARRVSRASVIA